MLFAVRRKLKYGIWRNLATAIKFNCSLNFELPVARNVVEIFSLCFIILYVSVNYVCYLSLFHIVNNFSRYGFVTIVFSIMKFIHYYLCFMNTCIV